MTTRYLEGKGVRKRVPALVAGRKGRTTSGGAVVGIYRQRWGTLLVIDPVVLSAQHELPEHFVGAV